MASQRIFRGVPYTLDDAEERNAAAPRSFFIPSAEVRRNLEPGDIVKLIFRLETADEVAVERMWVEVVDTDPYVGTLANEPQLRGVIAHGDRVEFGPEHVCAYAYTEAQLGYDPMATCHVSPAIVRRDVPPDGLYVGTEGQWAAFAGDQRPEHRWTLGDLTDRFPEIEEVLREGNELRDTWWRRDGDRYLRWQG